MHCFPGKCAEKLHKDPLIKHFFDVTKLFNRKKVHYKNAQSKNLVFKYPKWFRIKLYKYIQFGE